MIVTASGMRIGNVDGTCLHRFSLESVVLGVLPQGLSEEDGWCGFD